MPTEAEVRKGLAADEPHYELLAAELGEGALPHLAKIARGRQPLLASKAVFLASVIGGSGAAEVLARAAAHKEPVVRVAAGAAARNLNHAEATEVLGTLLEDDDPGVRKVALRSAARLRLDGVRDRVESMAERDPEHFLREQAQDALTRMTPR